MQVVILKESCEPDEFSYFCPARAVDPPITINKQRFSSLRHFLSYNMFCDKEPGFASLFTADKDVVLQQEFLRVHAIQGTQPRVGDMDEIMTFMRERPALLAFKSCVDSPSAQALFAEFEQRLRSNAITWIRSWVQHRFAATSFRGSFVSQDYSLYAEVLNEHIASLPRPRRSEPRRHESSKHESKHLRLFDLAFRDRDLAAVRKHLKENAAKD